jgi:hypothetical protein
MPRLFHFRQAHGDIDVRVGVLGHSLADNDDHILRRLGTGRFGKFYISLFGDVNSVGNKAIIAKAKSLAAMRQQRYPLQLAFFDAKTADPWVFYLVGNCDQLHGRHNLSKTVRTASVRSNLGLDEQGRPLRS